MTTHPPTEDGDRLSDREWARRLHDHTHEVELLISAALIFGLLQAPAAISSADELVSIRLTGALGELASQGSTYVTLIVYTLIVAFGVHILARAYWVGLIGLDSIFPEGVDWDEVGYGPFFKKIYREGTHSLPSLARSADRVASGVSSMALLFVWALAMSLAVLVAVTLVILAVTKVFPDAPGPLLFGTFWLLWLLVFAGLWALDRWAPERLRGDRPFGRVAEQLTRSMNRYLGWNLVAPIHFVLTTRLPKRTTRRLMIGAGVFIVGLVVTGEVVRSGRLALSPTELLPSDPGPRSVDARYFAPTRDPLSTAPFVQSEIITGPYVRLELPLVAGRDGRRIQLACADAGAPAAADTADADGNRGADGESGSGDAKEDPSAVLGCLGGLWGVTLDGEPVALGWEFRSTRRFGVTSLVAYIPTEGLAPGPHLLEIVVTHVDAEEASEHEHRPHYIRFRI